MIEAYRFGWAGPLLDRYNRHLLRKSFARIRVAGLDVVRGGGTMVLAPNHSCWWDGCVDAYLARDVLRRRNYLLMGEPELRKYPVFSSLGVFSGGVRYIVRELRAHPGALLWIYPQGEMLPARAPLAVRDGAAWIARAADVPVVPVAQRYEFVRDDHPEVFVRFGAPLRDVQDSAALRDAMVALLARVDEDVALQRLDAYETVMHGAETRSERLDRLRESRA